MLFGINVVCLDDNSNIECGVTNQTKGPPRKLQKPFSLAHLSIAEKGKTWYENNLGAFIHDSAKRERYQNSIQRLYDPTLKNKDDFSAFATRVRLHSQEQAEYLEPIYSRTDTWHEFFAAIPKQKQCPMLFNWLPSFLDDFLQFRPTHELWCVYLGSLGVLDDELTLAMPEMIRTDLFINMTTSFQTGGTRTKFTRYRRSQTHQKQPTRKSKIKLLSFSNSYY